MKKFFICILIAFSVFNTAFAESKVITQTQETDITCTIDGLFIESYAIDGFMYLPVERLSDYGFNLNKNEEVIELKRNEIVYFDDLYEKKDNDANLPVYENTTPVIIDEKIANTYVIEDRIVIQADELLAFGDVSWNENTQTVEISIIANELKNAFEKAEDKVTVTEGMTQISGQMQNNKWNGIVRTSGFQSMTYFGYMKDGEY